MDDRRATGVDGSGATRRKVLAGALAVGGVSALALGMPEEALASAPSDWYNVKVDYNARGDGSTDDTTAVQNAINAANSGNGGVVYFPPGTYEVGQLTTYSDVYFVGAGVGVSILQLKSGANSDLIITSGYSTSTTQQHFGFVDLSLDGNRSQNSSGGAGLRIYGKSFRVVNVDIYNCSGPGIFSSWQSGGDDMEAHLQSFKIHDCNGNGLEWHGPHDSCFVSFPGLPERDLRCLYDRQWLGMRVRQWACLGHAYICVVCHRSCVSCQLRRRRGE